MTIDKLNFFMTILPSRSPLSQPPKQLMAIRLSSGFSHLWRGVFHITLRTHKTQTYTTVRLEENENKQTRIWVGSSIKNEKFMTLLRSFLCICGLVRACIWVKFPQSHQELILPRWSIRPLSPQAQAPSLFCWLVSSVISGTLLPSSSSGLKLFVWVSRQNKRIHSLTPTPIETNATHRVTVWSLNCVQINDWIVSDKWQYLEPFKVCKRMDNIVLDYSC